MKQLPILEFTIRFLLRAQQSFQRGLQFASGVFVAGPRRHSDSRAKCFFRVVLLPELLIKLPELIVGCEVFGIGISAQA